ncbi:fumarylacetoacetase [Saprospiraceae bacterium]|jgi:fumarylacetoacetase|nr:fumarylacetoacetase [Saprospiraceae bacterium]MDC3210742.1 fumarylacetoacetase [Saprospiraceae bacterium]
MIRANNPTLSSWVAVPLGSDFPIQNLPFGIFKTKGEKPRVCSAIGDYVVDLAKVNDLAFFADLEIPKSIFYNQYINDFMALGKDVTRAVRDRLSEILDENETKWNSREMAKHIFYKMDEVELLIPIQIGDYTDFYSSIEHATNVGIMFRDPANALLPNWKHLPVGYHGRASSIVVSGTEIKRPKGQQIPKDSKQPVYGPCKLLDFELEMGFVIGQKTNLGDTVSIQKAEDYIFGMCLFNDWSARDIQKWEYVPLGPFLGKNFASTMSPWIVVMDALEPFRVPGPAQDPPVLPYLKYDGDKNYDINLAVKIKPEGSRSTIVSESNFKYMYWNMSQQLTHHTVNGCNINVGDLYASGTISGKTPESYGSMLEISWQGTKAVQMADGTERKFIADGDTVILEGWCEKDGVRIGFGEAVGKVLPADEEDLLT